jgi:hypothetical protein
MGNVFTVGNLFDSHTFFLHRIESLLRQFHIRAKHMLSGIVALAVIGAAFANRAGSMAIRGHAGLLPDAKQDAFGPRRCNGFGILVAYGISSIF